MIAGNIYQLQISMFDFKITHLLFKINLSTIKVIAHAQLFFNLIKIT